MQKILILAISMFFLMGLTVTPADALSSNAEKFLQACRNLDAEFPPPSWDKYELRDAALEVLDEIESGNTDLNWALDFCINTLGYTKFPEDIDRILSYESEMNYSVLIHLRGFQHPKVVDLYLRYIDNEKAPKRECAVRGLAAVDFNKYEKPSEMKNNILNVLNTALQKEKRDWLKKEITTAIEKVSAAKINKANVK